MKIDRQFVVAGLPLGPLLVLVGYALLLKSGAVINDLMLCLLLVWPTAVLLVAAAVAGVMRGEVSRWFSMAIGVTAGTGGVAVVVVVVGISAIAWMISDLG
jgi:hypothetical protein